MSTEQTLRDHIMNELCLEGSAAELANDAFLLDITAVDPPGLRQLVAHIEDHCDIDILEEELAPSASAPQHHRPADRVEMAYRKAARIGSMHNDD